jgi:hypothetical protein
VVKPLNAVSKTGVAVWPWQTIVGETRAPAIRLVYSDILLRSLELGQEAVLEEVHLVDVVGVPQPDTMISGITNLKYGSRFQLPLNARGLGLHIWCADIRIDCTDLGCGKRKVRKRQPEAERAGEIIESRQRVSEAQAGREIDT